LENPDIGELNASLGQKNMIINTMTPMPATIIPIRSFLGNFCVSNSLSRKAITAAKNTNVRAIAVPPRKQAHKMLRGASGNNNEAALTAIDAASAPNQSSTAI
jgi:hypothetical protein